MIQTVDCTIPACGPKEFVTASGKRVIIPEYDGASTGGFLASAASPSADDVVLLHPASEVSHGHHGHHHSGWVRAGHISRPNTISISLAADVAPRIVPAVMECQATSSC